MKIKQISVFLENRPGQLAGVVTDLGRAKVNILSMTLADNAEFGILRLIPSDMDAALAVLSASGCVVRVSEVVAVSVPHRPGGLGEFLAALGKSNVNVEYMYAHPSSAADGEAVIIFRFSDTESALAALDAMGARVLTPDEVLSELK